MKMSDLLKKVEKAYSMANGKIEAIVRDGASPTRGDVIGVHRAGGVYDHYGIYERDDIVYEYAGDRGDFDDVMVRRTTLEKFLAGSDELFVVEFREGVGGADCGQREIGVGAIADIISRALSSGSGEIRIYTPDETIERARSRVGEASYHLLTNNCEHFAIWCKIGIGESSQVRSFIDGVVKLISGLVERR